MKDKRPNTIDIRNKRAGFEYELLDRYTAGIVLYGTEIKSLRLGKASLTDCYCYFHNGELFVRGMNIAEYHWGSYNNHVPKRDRKLLLKKKEINDIVSALAKKGATLVAIRLFFNEKGRAKLEVGLGTGKKNFDKRETIKNRDWNREKARVMAKFS